MTKEELLKKIEEAIDHAASPRSFDIDADRLEQLLRCKYLVQYDGVQMAKHVSSLNVTHYA